VHSARRRSLITTFAFHDFLTLGENILNPGGKGGRGKIGRELGERVMISSGDSAEDGRRGVISEDESVRVAAGGRTPQAGLGISTSGGLLLQFGSNRFANQG